MDLPSFRRGNILAGNDENDGAIEVTLLGPTLFVAEGEGMVAATGADLGFQINGRPAPMWTAVAVGAGMFCPSPALCPDAAPIFVFQEEWTCLQ